MTWSSGLVNGSAIGLLKD